jgi:hypothetical protein
MKTDAQIEIASYMGDLLFTLLFVFEKIVHPEILIKWLQPMLMDDDQRAMLLHEEPLYVAADFLEIDRLRTNFREIERKYLEFRNSFLFNQTLRPSPQLEATLRESLSRNLSKSNIHYLHSFQDQSRNVVKYAEPIGEKAPATTSHAKNVPQHPERATLRKMRETETPGGYPARLKMRRRRLGVYASTAHSKSQKPALRKNYAVFPAGHVENDNI